MYSLEHRGCETDDVIAFHSSMDTGAIITHRVIKNDIVTGQIHTKGDANEKEDLYPVGYELLHGEGSVFCSCAGTGTCIFRDISW